MVTRKVLKHLFLTSVLAGALLVAGPTQARDRDHGQRHEYRHDGAGRGHQYGGHRDGHGWRGNDRGHYGGHGWGYRPYGYYQPRHYYHSYGHRHYRGCGHDGYHHDGLVEFLVDYGH